MRFWPFSRKTVAAEQKSLASPDAAMLALFGLTEATSTGIIVSEADALILGNDPADPGQLLLWMASRSRCSYPFRLVFPDGVTARNWFALVIRIGEVFDTANSVMKLQVDLKPTSVTGGM